MNEHHHHLLLVEDDPDHAELIRLAFEPKSDTFEIRHVESLARARESIHECLPDLIIVDLVLPDGKGLDLIPSVQDEAQYPTMIMTSQGDEAIAVEAIKAGALDYIVKSSSMFTDMPKLAERALREWSVMVEHKRTQEALQRSEQQLRQAQKMDAIGTLAGGIAHDFNNILTAMLGFTELSVLTLPVDDPVYRNLQEVSKAGNRARKLIEQILTFSRQTGGDRLPTLLSELVEEVLQLIRATLPATIEVRKNLLTHTGTIFADPTQIHQVLVNLCANAEHAMRSNGGVLEVQLEETMVDVSMTKLYANLQPGPHLKLTVRDTGQGMPADVLARVFDPFFTTKEVGEGTGLGLSVAHGIVTNHGGVIAVKSMEGVGTTFTLYFPQVEPVIEATLNHEWPNLTSEGGQILFVDDEEPLARLGKHTLELFGYTVTTQTNSLTALETFLRMPHKYDMVITDQTMPTMTGEALATELLKIRPDLPIILCTGFSHTITPERATALGIRGFLLKPLLPQEMARVVKEVLQSQREFPPV